MFPEASGYTHSFFGRRLGSTLQFLGQASQGSPQPSRAAEALLVTRPVPKTCPFKTHTTLAPPSWPALTSALPTAAWSSHFSLHHHLCTTICHSLLLSLPSVVFTGENCALCLDSRPSCPHSHSFLTSMGGFGGGRQEDTSVLYRPAKISNGYIFDS